MIAFTGPASFQHAHLSEPLRGAVLAVVGGDLAGQGCFFCVAEMTETAMTATVQALLAPAIGELCAACGFHSVQEHVVSALADVMSRYAQLLATRTVATTQHCTANNFLFLFFLFLPTFLSRFELPPCVCSFSLINELLHLLHLLHVCVLSGLSWPT